MGQARKRGTQSERVVMAQERDERLRREAVERERHTAELELARRAALTPEQRDAEDRRKQARSLRAMSWLAALQLFANGGVR